MFDIGFTELLIVGIVALIVVGPKDLPGMFRTLGRFTGKARNMAREFQRAMDAAADEAGVKDIKNTMSDVKKATSAKSLGLDGLKDAADRFEKWEPGKPRPADAPKPALQTTDPGAVAADAKPATGANTQALAKSLEEQRAARLAAAAERRAAKAAAAEPAAKPAPKAPAPKAATKAATKAAPKTAPKTATKASPKPAAKPAKPRARKPAKSDPEASA